MKIMKVNSDILRVQEGIIVHGVNCQGVMASGIAKQIRDKYPIVYSEYRRFVSKLVYSEYRRFVSKFSDPYLPEYTKNQLLGKCNYVPINSKLLIVNLFSQFTYGYDPTVQYASAQAIVEGMSDIFRVARLYSSKYNVPLTIHIPKIGCGLGGLDWSEVEPMINSLVDYHFNSSYRYSYNITLYIHDLDLKECPFCHGTGIFEHYSIQTDSLVPSECHSCRGSGLI